MLECEDKEQISADEVCDGIMNCSQTETSDGGEDEDEEECDFGEGAQQSEDDYN